MKIERPCFPSRPSGFRSDVRMKIEETKFRLSGAEKVLIRCIIRLSGNFSSRKSRLDEREEKKRNVG